VVFLHDVAQHVDDVTARELGVVVVGVALEHPVDRAYGADIAVFVFPVVPTPARLRGRREQEYQRPGRGGLGAHYSALQTGRVVWVWVLVGRGLATKVNAREACER
jgi:hypothetical protein